MLMVQNKKLKMRGIEPRASSSAISSALSYVPMSDIALAMQWN